MSKPAVPWQERGESDTPHTLSRFVCVRQALKWLTQQRAECFYDIRMSSQVCMFSKNASLPLQATCQSGLDEGAGRRKLRLCPVNRTFNWADLIDTALSAVLDYLQYFGNVLWLSRHTCTEVSLSRWASSRKTWEISVLELYTSSTHIKKSGLIDVCTLQDQHDVGIKNFFSQMCSWRCAQVFYVYNMSHMENCTIYM